jgi:hypothetical protein
MKCKACNSDFDPHMRVLKDTGQRVLEDLCSVCRRDIYARSRLNEEEVQSTINAIVGTREHYGSDDG